MIALRHILVATDFGETSTAALRYGVELARRFHAQVLSSDELRHVEPLCAMRLGVAADEIVRYADDSDIDLIVMGTHGREGVVRALMGSVAEKVVRRATCPVLTIHHAERQVVVANHWVGVGMPAAA